MQTQTPHTDRCCTVTCCWGAPDCWCLGTLPTLENKKNMLNCLWREKTKKEEVICFGVFEMFINKVGLHRSSSLENQKSTGKEHVSKQQMGTDSFEASTRCLFERHTYCILKTQVIYKHYNVFNENSPPPEQNSVILTLFRKFGEWTMNKNKSLNHPIKFEQTTKGWPDYNITFLSLWM